MSGQVLYMATMLLAFGIGLFIGTARMGVRLEPLRRYVAVLAVQLRATERQNLLTGADPDMLTRAARNVVTEAHRVEFIDAPPHHAKGKP